MSVELKEVDGYNPEWDHKRHDSDIRSVREVFVVRALDRWVDDEIFLAVLIPTAVEKAK
jgi:hypothetical protein